MNCELYIVNATNLRSLWIQNPWSTLLAVQSDRKQFIGYLNCFVFYFIFSKSANVSAAIESMLVLLTFSKNIFELILYELHLIVWPFCWNFLTRFFLSFRFSLLCSMCVVHVFSILRIPFHLYVKISFVFVVLFLIFPRYIVFICPRYIVFIRPVLHSFDSFHHQHCI